MSSCCSFNPSLHTSSSPKSSLRQRCFTFSEDGRFFAVGTTEGFIVYCTEPFVPLTVRETGNGGVSLISIFARSNLLLLVSPANPKTVLLWNEALSPPAVCGEVSFHSDVMAVRLHQALVVIADSHGVHVFNQKMSCSHSFQYNEASRSVGLSSLAIAGSAVCSSSSLQHLQFASNCNSNNNDGNNGNESTSSSTNSLPTLLMMQQQQQQNNNNNNNNSVAMTMTFPLALACPITVGNLLLVLIDNSNPAKPKVLHRRSVAVHNKALQISVFSQNGRFVATCSSGGTAIKLTHVHSGSVLMQFNRGTTPNQIHSLAFAGLSYVACVSGTGSVHLFAIIDKVRKMLEKIDDPPEQKKKYQVKPNNNNNDSDDDEDQDEDQEVAKNSNNDKDGNNNNNNTSFEDLGEAAVLVRNSGNNQNGGIFGFVKTIMQSTTDFHEGIWACGHFDMLQLHPSAAKRALFGPAICSFLSDGMSEDDGSLKFLVAHGESGKIGKVNFSPNDSAAERNSIQQNGAAVVQSQNAALLQAAMGNCKLINAWSFPTDAF